MLIQSALLKIGCHMGGGNINHLFCQMCYGREAPIRGHALDGSQVPGGCQCPCHALRQIDAELSQPQPEPEPAHPILPVLKEILAGDPNDEWLHEYVDQWAKAHKAGKRKAR